MLGSTIDKILESYYELGGINHITGPKLPSRAAVVRIVEDLEAIVFPGYHEEEPARVENLKFALAEKLNRVTRALTNEIQKCLCFQFSVEMACGECEEEKNNEAMARCRDRAEEVARARGDRSNDELEPGVPKPTGNGQCSRKAIACILPRLS